MYLTALNGGKGDAFLLQDNGDNYLIDGGNNAKILPDIPKNIQAVIVTHNDMDHCRGIISILEDGHFNIAEIWLPGYWQPVLSFIYDVFYNGDSIIMDDPHRAAYDGLSPDSLLEDSNDDLGMENISTLIDGIDCVIEDNNIIVIDGKYIQFIKRPIDSFVDVKQWFEIKNIVKIAKLAFQNCIEIKWFYPKDNLVKTRTGNFTAMNSELMCRMKKIKSNSVLHFLQLYTLTKENKYSLVFLYEKEGVPKILFTADSGLSFCKDGKLDYPHQIVVTAPHHGSNNKENERVYDIIDCPDAVYLRSGSIKQVSNKFEDLDRKVCNNCKKYNLNYQEAKLIHKDNMWIISSGYVCTKKGATP
jgi:hypothetical protein